MPLDSISTPSPVYLSIVVPAYNEEKRIGSTLKSIVDFVAGRNISSEIIVVDDCSTDKTREVVAEAAVIHPLIQLISEPLNRGKGHAVRVGMLKARGAYRLFSDADLSTPIEEVQTFFPFLKNQEHEDGYDIVVGSRHVRGAHIGQRQPWRREMAGRFFNAMVRGVALSGIHDTQCGFKLFTASAAQIVFSKQTIEGFGFDVEILYLAQKRGLKIKEAPVRWFDSPNSRIRLGKDSLAMFFDVMRVRWNDGRGRY